MTTRFPMVPLGQTIRHRKEFIQINDLETYKRCRVQLHAKGIVLRDMVSGSEIKTKEQQVCRAGEFLVAEIDAKVGGFGVVPDDLDGAIVSSHYFLFEIDETALDRRFLDYFIRTSAFQDQVSAQGSTNYAAIRPNDVLRYQMPLPSMKEQRRIVARIEELAAKIEDGRSLRQQAAGEAHVILRAAVGKMDSQLRKPSSMTMIERLASREKGSLRSGPFGSALLHSEFVPDGVPAIGIQDVQENRFVLTRRWNVTDKKADELKRYTIKPRDILVTVMGTLGRCCVVPDDAPRMVSTKHVWTITLDQTKAEPRWVSYWLNFSRNVREELLGQGAGTAISGLNGGKIRVLSLPALSLSEQRRIVGELDTLNGRVDALKRLQSETAGELDALLPSVLDKAFKGEL